MALSFTRLSSFHVFSILTASSGREFNSARVFNSLEGSAEVWFLIISVFVQPP